MAYISAEAASRAAAAAAAAIATARSPRHSASWRRSQSLSGSSGHMSWNSSSPAVIVRRHHMQTTVSRSGLASLIPECGAGKRRALAK